MYEESGSEAFGKLVLRLSVGILMLFHGVAKILNPGSIDYIGGLITGINPALPMELAYGVYLGEVAAPILVILGLFTRFGGAVMAINMVVAIIIAHSAQLMTMTENGGYGLELQALFLFGSIAIAFLGGGRYAVRPEHDR